MLARMNFAASLASNQRFNLARAAKSVSSTPNAILWRHPLETASQSEGGFERTYQGSVIVPVWRDITVGDGQPFECKVTIEMVSI